MASAAVITAFVATAAGACSASDAPQRLEVETTGGEPIIEAAEELYSPSEESDDASPWSDADLDSVGFARVENSAVVAFEGSAGGFSEGEALAVVRVVQAGDEWDVRGGLFACRSEELGISFAFADEEDAEGFVVALHAEEGDEITHGSLRVDEDARMIAWSASVDASHPVEYIGDSETGRFCR